MNNNEASQNNKQFHVFWISYYHLENKLSGASRLEVARELREAGLQVTLVSIGPTGKQIVRGVETDCIDVPDIYFVGQALFHLKAIAMLRRTHPQPDFVLFAQDSLMWVMPLRLLRALRRKNRPIFVLDTRSVHMADPRTEKPHIKLRGLFLKWMNRLGNHWVDGQTVITKRMAASLGVPKDKLWGVWTSGVTLKPFQQSYHDRQWPEPEEAIQLVYIGTLSDERNIDIFCQAVIKANEKHKRFHLKITGAGPAYSKIEKIAAESGGCIELANAVPHHEVPALLTKAHVGVLPFPDEEKFRVSSPVKLFEYMAAGLPILATRIVCHTDVVGERTFSFWAEDSSVNGFLAALDRVDQNRERFTEMGREAAEASHDLTWHASAMRLKTALEHGLEQMP